MSEMTPESAWNEVLCYDASGHPISASTVISAYHQRCFPMSETRNGSFSWYLPADRAVITWDHFKIPRSLKQLIRKRPFKITLNKAFPQVIEACAQREETWIAHDIERLYVRLHYLGFAHSVECWDADHALIGGCYGLSIGACFCGESMFHRADNASKIAVAYLIHYLQGSGFSMLDCQQQTPHMQRFGAREMDDEAYAMLFDVARFQECELREVDWNC